MARFGPFVGLRYSGSVPLDQVVAPPYDVVSPDQRAELAARHRANAIHVELPEDAAAGDDRYAAAAALLEEWREGAKLVPDRAPTLTVYRMTPPGGRPVTGVVGALGCDPTATEVLPHEQTIPKDASDRLDLLRATRVNLSPIWGLSLAGGLAELYRAEADARDPDARATDDDGVVHEAWVVDDPGAIAAYEKVVGSAPVVLADGHHRYQTALTYAAEQDRPGGRPHGTDAVMAFVVELAEDELQVGPIHRSLHGVRSEVELTEHFAQWFETVDAGTPEPELLSSVAASNALALVTARAVVLLTARPEALRAAGSDLDSSLVALAVEALPGAHTAHHHDWHDAFAALRDGEAQAAVLLRPVTVAQIGQWAHDRRRMPPKSTYFTPKPRTGFVFRPLDPPG